MRGQVDPAGVHATIDPMPAARAVLIDMLSPAHPLDTVRTAGLDARAWIALALLARQHRLEPTLYQAMRDAGSDWPVPADVADQWRTAFHRAARRALALEQALLRVSRCLDAAAIPYAALKGATLAWTAYPHPALRKMRDLDILVSRDRAIAARDALIADGIEVAPGFSTPPAWSLAHDKHFAPMRDPTLGVAIELHFSCTEATAPGGGTSEFHDIDTLLARSTAMTLRGRAVHILSPTDTLLHLIVHALHDHRFDIGPMVLADLAHLLRFAAIDWDMFWRMADHGGWTRSCHLCLALSEQAHGDLPILFDGPRQLVPEALSRDAFDLMLCDTDALREMHVAVDRRDAKSLRARTAFYAKRIFAPRHTVARWAGVTADQPGLARFYALRFMELVRTQLRWQRDAHPEAGANAERLTRVTHWLTAAPP